jgi:predicted secreted protein
MVCALAISVSCNSASGTKELEFTKDDTLAQIQPEKPVQIKLKRKDNGAYSWEIKGDDAEKIMAVDTKLRKYTTHSKEEK